MFLAHLVEHKLWVLKVVGSIPAKYKKRYSLDFLCYFSWGCSSIGRAFDWQSRGSEFDPRQLHSAGGLGSSPRLKPVYVSGGSLMEGRAPAITYAPILLTGQVATLSRWRCQFESG